MREGEGGREGGREGGGREDGIYRHLWAGGVFQVSISLNW